MSATIRQPRRHRRRAKDRDRLAAPAPAAGAGWLEVGWKYLLAVVIIFYAAFPLVYMLSASLNPNGNLSATTGLFSAFDLANFAALGGTQLLDVGRATRLLIAGRHRRSARC